MWRITRFCGSGEWFSFCHWCWVRWFTHSLLLFFTQNICFFRGWKLRPGHMRDLGYKMWEDLREQREVWWVEVYLKGPTNQSVCLCQGLCVTSLSSGFVVLSSTVNAFTIRHTNGSISGEILPYHERHNKEVLRSVYMPCLWKSWAYHLVKEWSVRNYPLPVLPPSPFLPLSRFLNLNSFLVIFWLFVWGLFIHVRFFMCSKLQFQPRRSCIGVTQAHASLFFFLQS